jgi:hypothetical protein
LKRSQKAAIHASAAATKSCTNTRNLRVFTPLFPSAG